MAPLCSQFSETCILCAKCPNSHYLQKCQIAAIWTLTVVTKIFTTFGPIPSFKLRYELNELPQNLGVKIIWTYIFSSKNVNISYTYMCNREGKNYFFPSKHHFVFAKSDDGFCGWSLVAENDSSAVAVYASIK